MVTIDFTVHVDIINDMYVRAYIYECEHMYVHMDCVCVCVGGGWVWVC